MTKYFFKLYVKIDQKMKWVSSQAYVEKIAGMKSATDLKIYSINEDKILELRTKYLLVVNYGYLV